MPSVRLPLPREDDDDCGRSASESQIRFLWLLDPIKRWPALPVLVLCVFRRARHRVETVWQVEAFDALPLVVYELASVDADHCWILLGG